MSTLTSVIRSYLIQVFDSIPKDHEYWTKIAILFTVYLATAKFGLSFFAINIFAAPVWPCSGIAIAALLLFGMRLWPAIALGAFVVNLVTGAPVLAALAIAAGNTLEAFIGTHVLRHYINIERPFSLLKDSVGILLAALVAPLVSAVIGVAALTLSGTVHADLIRMLYAWWSGDGIGILVVTPFILSWFVERPLLPGARRALEFAGIFAVLLSMCYVIFWTDYFPYVFPLAIPFAWAAFRTGPRGVSVAIIVLAAIGVPATIAGEGAFRAHDAFAGIAFLQFAIAIASSLFIAMSSIIEERKHALRGLQAQVGTLEIMLTKTRSDDKAKTEFIAALAHELRNPLAPIVSSLELMKVQVEKSDLFGIPRLIEVMDAHIHTVTKLLDDLLDVSRISHKKFNLDASTIDLQSVVARSRETVETFYQSREHELIIVMPSEPIWLSADPLRLQQVLVNILYNAGKYTNPGGRIVLSATRKDEKALITIKDNGIGIPAYMLSKIFEPFVQLQDSSKVGAGLGIGLFLTKRLVELHGGTIMAKSEGLGKGSEFSIELPAPATIQLPVYASTVLGTPGMRFDVDRPRSAGHTVLIVDDNEPAALGLMELLRHRGHGVSVTHDGPTALAWLSRNEVDIVLLDIGLPGMSGYEVAEKIRSQKKYAELILIALTGYGQKEDKIMAEKAGFNHHLTKPVTAKEVEEAMLRQMRLKKKTKTRSALTRP
jgi:signal transduction histidine kinase/CheY-like chemotaxis protein